MKTIDLEFKGYSLEVDKDGIPAVSGVYCVYTCVYNEDKDTVTLKTLIYIGESDNVHERIANHDRLDDWMDSLRSGQTLCYSYANVSSADRERAEAALIFKIQPPFNTEHTKEFIYEDTEIKTSGRNYLLPESFAVKKGAKK
jgi:hypothetical protein